MSDPALLSFAERKRLFGGGGGGGGGGAPRPSPSRPTPPLRAKPQRDPVDVATTPVAGMSDPRPRDDPTRSHSPPTPSPNGSEEDEDNGVGMVGRGASVSSSAAFFKARMNAPAPLGSLKAARPAPSRSVAPTSAIVRSGSGEARPVVSVEQRPIEQRPVEQRPIEQRPIEQRPVEQRPVEQRPVDRRPVEQHPVEHDICEASVAAKAALFGGKSTTVARNFSVCSAPGVVSVLSQRNDAERKARQQKEAERMEAERREAQRREAEAQRREAGRMEAERREAERRETQRREAERMEAERREAQRREAETQRREAERMEAERREAERRETQRREAERMEAERREAQRREAETQRREAERMEAERRETQPREAEQSAFGAPSGSVAARAAMFVAIASSPPPKKTTAASSLFTKPSSPTQARPPREDRLKEGSVENLPPPPAAEDAIHVPPPPLPAGSIVPQRVGTGKAQTTSPLVPKNSEESTAPHPTPPPAQVTRPVRPSSKAPDSDQPELASVAAKASLFRNAASPPSPTSPQRVQTPPKMVRQPSPPVPVVPPTEQPSPSATPDPAPSAAVVEERSAKSISGRRARAASMRIQSLHENLGAEKMVAGLMVGGGSPLTRMRAKTTVECVEPPVAISGSSVETVPQTVSDAPTLERARVPRRRRPVSMRGNVESLLAAATPEDDSATPGISASLPSGRILCTVASAPPSRLSVVGEEEEVVLTTDKPIVAEDVVKEVDPKPSVAPRRPVGGVPIFGGGGGSPRGPARPRAPAVSSDLGAGKEDRPSGRLFADETEDATTSPVAPPRVRKPLFADETEDATTSPVAPPRVRKPLFDDETKDPTTSSVAHDKADKSHATTNKAHILSLFEEDSDSSLLDPLGLSEPLGSGRNRSTAAEPSTTETQDLTAKLFGAQRPRADRSLFEDGGEGLFSTVDVPKQRQSQKKTKKFSLFDDDDEGEGDAKASGLFS